MPSRPGPHRLLYPFPPVTLLSARSLTKAYGPQTLFRDISLTITAGDRIGLLGINGSGKSTLLKVLAGIEPYDAGVIDKRRGARIAYLPQEPELRPEANAREVASEGLVDWYAATARHTEVTHLIDGGAHDDALLEEQAQLSETVEHLGGWQRDHVVHEYLTKLGITDLAQPVGTMSGGERRRVALARLLVSEPELAILDEPTNHLDTETIEWLEGVMGAMKGAVLLVTHDRYVLDAIATRIFELENGGLREFRGNYGDYIEQKALLLEQEGRVESNRQNLVRRELAWLRRGAKARSTKQKARIQRAEAVIAVQAPREAGKVKLDSVAMRTGKTILELRDVGLDLGGRTLMNRLTLHLVSGDRIGVIGPNGVGKTTLLRLVTGDLTPTRGEVVRGVQTKIAYFDQARAGLIDDWSIFDNVAEREGAERTGGGMVHLGDRTLDLRTYLDQFLFDPSKQRQKVGSLSGGERARVGLAKMLKTGANLLLLDEPTNDLDISTLGALEEMLVDWPGCALVVTHDRYFLNRIATSVLAFERGKTEVLHYGGGYDDYRATRDLAEAPAPPPPRTPTVPPPRAQSLPGWTESASPRTKSSPPPSKNAPPRAKSTPPPAPPKKSLTYGERMELDKILGVIAKTEEELASVEARLADPTLYATRGTEVRPLEEERARIATRVGELTARWEDLENRKDVAK
jgi:ATP-binding cassette subfamily F protein uup